MSSILIKNGTIATLGTSAQVLEGHDLWIEGDTIARIAPAGQREERLAETVINAQHKVVMPGFINAHMHFYSTFARGLGKAQPAKDFLEVLDHLWWRLDKKLTLDDCYYSAYIACIDAIRHGTTTIIDHHASPFAARGSLERIADAIKETGLRASLCYELSDRDGPEIAEQGIEENAAFLARCAKDNDPQLRALFGLHAAFTIGDATLERAVAKGKALGAGFHIHVAEDASDQEHSLKEHGMRVLKRLQTFGVLGEKTICAHCVHVDEEEIDILAQTGTAVAHNAQSNMNNAVGAADLTSLFKKGVLVGLGTDAMTNNMLEEVRAALWNQRSSHKDPSAGFMEVTQALLENNAAIANRYWGDLGALEEGKKADVIVMDYHPPTTFNADTFAGHLVFGLSQASVNTTIASGKILMHDKELVDIDEAKIAAEARECAKALWERF